MKRTLRRGEAVIRFNELQVIGTPVQVILVQGTEELSILKVLVAIDCVNIVSEAGEVLASNCDGTGWFDLNFAVGQDVKDYQNDLGIEPSDFEMEDRL